MAHEEKEKEQEQPKNTRKAIFEPSESIEAYAQDLHSLAQEMARRRQPIEERWFAATLQYYGLYDDDVARKLEENKGSSKLFVNQTRPKTRVLVARLIDILFPTDESNWDINPTPVPRVEKALSGKSAKPEFELAAAEEKSARDIRDLAKVAAAGMKRQMSDQMEECGYVSIGEKVISQACKLGMGIAKGPFVDLRSKDAWTPGDNGKWSRATVDDDRPAFEWVNAWEFFWDMDAERPEDMEFCFELHRFSRTDVRKYAQRGFFNKDVVADMMSMELSAPVGDTYFTQYKKFIKMLDQTFDDGNERRFDVFEYHGPIPYETFEELAKRYDQNDLIGALGDSDAPYKTVMGSVWFTHERILRFGPYEDQSDTQPPYSCYMIDKSDGTMCGYGVPDLLKDPQSAINAAWRMMMQNAGLAGVPMYIIDEQMVEPAGESGEALTIGPGKIWLRKGPGGPNAGPAIEVVKIEGMSESLIAIVNFAKKFCEEETNIPLAAQGDQGSGPRQTAHGMQLLSTAANIIFRNAARNFDHDFTIPNLKRLYDWNMRNLEDESIKGDMKIAARGHSVLLVREIRAQNLMLILNMIGSNPDIAAVYRIAPIARELARSLQLAPVEIVLTDKEITEQEEAARQNPPVDPELEKAKAVEEMRGATQLQIAQQKFEADILKLATQEKLTGAQIEAKLNELRESNLFKERLAAADIAVKEKHGEGALSTV